MSSIQRSTITTSQSLRQPSEAQVQPRQASSSWEIPSSTTSHSVCRHSDLLRHFGRDPLGLQPYALAAPLYCRQWLTPRYGIKLASFTAEKIIPLSAYISCCSIGLLLNYAHSSWILILPVFLTIASKYILTFNGRHVFNPSLFGLAACLLFTNEVITAAPAYQWLVATSA